MKAIKINSIKNFTLLIVLLLCLNACKKETKTEVGKDEDLTNIEEQLYRPNFHFTPKANWMNDPNGMFYLNGKYHLYFQYYPEDNVWGPMHWGHATTTDLVTWKEQPIAIYPDSIGYIFSGSAVVDKHNTSGFGKDGKAPIVAMFTYHNIEGERAKRIDFQSQAIAYSLDEGQSWTKYKGNPVILNPGIKDFRDPKVTWDETSKQWVMALATYEKTLIYGSKNLKEWELLSSFGADVGEHGGVWECPDFFPLKVEGTEETKWVMLQSLNPGHINGGSGTQYFIGDFNGKDFVLDPSFAQDLKEEKAIWLDFGRDNYAGVTWSNIPDSDGRKLFIGWMSNWDYAQVVPTETWRSAMTIPRALNLKKSNGKYRIVSNPVKELDAYKSLIIDKTNIAFSDTFTVIEKGEVDISKSVIKMVLSNLKTDNYTFVLSNNDEEVLTFGLDNKSLNYFVDRTKSGDSSFSEKFANTVSKAAFNSIQEEVKIEILIDKTSIELFYNDGETVMTEIFFSKSPFNKMVLKSTNNSGGVINKLEVNQLKF